ncbi:unnamed protein product [Rotaria magnacalcarata]|uniref:Uncharacterized protein n=1 Tax=Rotaria magnacalcarata TaxID=392030 RepID=A0A819YLS8_9BILA|nr:unnamed protein product [Rotaria magnacalcarata]
MMQRREIFKSLLEREFIYDEWKSYVSKVFDAGILSTEILMDTPRKMISRLQSIPQAPLDRLIKLATNRFEKTVKNLNNTYSQPLSSNRLVTDFEFVPAFTYLQYLKSTPLTDKENELKRTIAKVDNIDYATGGLLKHEAVFLALYCQESSNRCESFYTVAYSSFEDEKEVVVGFCSKWEVLSVETNKYELFSFGEYQCDYFIELQQLDSEPLFAANAKLRGLYLLAKIDYHS